MFADDCINLQYHVGGLPLFCSMIQNVAKICITTSCIYTVSIAHRFCEFCRSTNKLGAWGGGSNHKFTLQFPPFPTTVIVKCCDELMLLEINMFD